MKKHAEKLLGKQVAVLCSRYQYRGVLTEATNTYLILSYATSVEVPGKSENKAPITEDYIGSDICINYTAIEILYQPRWSQAPLGQST